MSYNLYENTTDNKSLILSEEDLYAAIIRQNSHYSPEKGVDESLPLCFLCCTERCNVFCIGRSCLGERRPCEGHTCTCNVVEACGECLSTQLWKGTDQVLRDRQIFRAKCPFCKAEFCNLDILLNPN